MSFSKPVLYVVALSSCALLATALVPAIQEMAMPQPTEQHKIVLADVGEWEGTLTNYMDPTAKPTPVPAKETVTAIGGFWVLSNFHCDFMGMAYHGSGHYGYDPDKKKYIGTWVDNMSSYFSLMEGEYDAAKKTLVYRWKAPDQTGKIVPQRSESVENGDTRTMTFFSGEGAGTKSMVIEMKRKKARAAEAGATK
jgi:hypothetical protein